MADKYGIDYTIGVDVYYNLDEETGFNLDREGMTDEFMSRLGELEEKLSELNYQRNEHLRTKHMEG